LRRIGLVCLIVICVFSIVMVKSCEIQDDLKNNLIRMHIIANSNRKDDQDIKIKVRDALILSGSYELNDLEKTANDILRKENANYTAKAEYKTCYVPQKEYKNIALPEGYYRCLNVELGRAAGKNWWCVAYPPLCFTESVFGEMSDDAKKILKNQLTKEALETIIQNENINYKFKTVEDMQKIINMLR